MKKNTRKCSSSESRDPDTEAFNCAIRIFTRRDHTEKELVDKLRQRKFGEPDIDDAAKRCRALGYIDDAKTAMILAKHMAARGDGPLKIRWVLHQKGVDEAAVENALTCCGDEKDQVQSALYALKKIRYRLNRETDPRKRRARAQRFLAGRGFTSEVIHRIVDNI